MPKSREIFFRSMSPPGERIAKYDTGAEDLLVSSNGLPRREIQVSPALRPNLFSEASKDVGGRNRGDHGIPLFTPGG